MLDDSNKVLNEGLKYLRPNVITMASRHQRHGNGKRKINPKLLPYAATIIVIVIVIAAVAYMLSYKSIQNLGSGGNVTISSRGAVFMLGGTEYAAYMGSGNVMYLSKQPGFVNPELAVYLSKGVTVHVNYLSKYSDIGAELLSQNGSSSTVRLDTISQSSAVSPDSSLIKVVSLNSTYVVTTTTTQNVSKPDTTITKVSTSLTTTVNPNVTTTKPNAYSKALSLLQSSSYYSIMQNYSEIYSNTSLCTAALYNKTYSSENFGSTPSGQNTYANVTSIVPFNMSYTLNDVSGPLYRVNYTTISHSTITTGVAFSMLINTSDDALENPTFSGAFLDNNVSTLYQGYISALRINRYCGIYIS